MIAYDLGTYTIQENMNLELRDLTSFLYLKKFQVYKTIAC